MDAVEAERMGLVNRVVAPGTARAEAESLARTLAAYPQTCLREDRLSVLEQDGLSELDALDALDALDGYCARSEPVFRGWVSHCFVRG